MIETELTDDELTKIALASKEEVRRKGGDARNIYEHNCAVQAVIRVFKLNDKFTAHDLDMGGNKWAKVKYSGVESNRILVAKSFHNAHYTIFVRPGLDYKTFEICGYYTQEQVKSAPTFKHLHGERYDLHINDLHPIEGFSELFEKAEVKEIEAGKSNPWPNIAAFFQDEVAKSKATSAAQKAWVTRRANVSKPTRPRTGRKLDPRAMALTQKFVEQSGGLPINASMYANAVGIARGLAQERLNTASKRGFVNIHPNSTLRNKWYITK